MLTDIIQRWPVTCLSPGHPQSSSRIHKPQGSRLSCVMGVFTQPTAAWRNGSSRHQCWENGSSNEAWRADSSEPTTITIIIIINHKIRKTQCCYATGTVLGTFAHLTLPCPPLCKWRHRRQSSLRNLAKVSCLMCEPRLKPLQCFAIIAPEGNWEPVL